MHDWNNTPTQQYVRSFFMDETEVTNAMYDTCFGLRICMAKMSSSEIYTTLHFLIH